MRINKTATYIRPGYYQEFVEGGDLGASAQDIESRIAETLFGGDDGTEPELDSALDDGQPQDDLPEDDDVEDEDDVDIDGEPEDEPNGEDEGDQTLASVLGLDDDKLAFNESGDVVFNAIIDGKAQQVSMNDLVKSYQLEGHVNNKSIALENDRKEFEQTRDKAYQELTQRLEHAEKLIEVSTQALTSEFQSIDWESLRYSDPAEWAAQRQLFQERLAQIDQAKQMIGNDKGKLTEEQQLEQQNKQQAFIEQEINKMIAHNPTWADQSVMAKEVGEIGQFLQSEFGFSPEEIANSMDSRLMRLIQMAYGAHKGTKQIKDKKIPDNVPKFRKPGQNNSNRDSINRARKAKAQKEAIRKSGGSVETIAASLIDRM